MQLSAVLNIFIVKTLFNSVFTNDLKRIVFLNVHSYRSSLFKNKMDYWYSHEVSQQNIYNMDWILSLKRIRDDAL